jgi:5'-nucleotidase
MRRLGWLLPAALGLFLAACIDEGVDYQIDGTDVEAVFLHTSDIHSRLLPYRMDVLFTDEQLGLLQKNAPFGGMARLASVVKQERRDSPRMANLDSGDVFQGAPIFNAFGGTPEFKAMTQLGVDAFAIGNHEFDLGTAHFIAKATTHANFPMLAANYAIGDASFPGHIQSNRVAAPYTILNLRGLRVGVVGLGYVGGSPFHGGGAEGVVPLRNVDVVQSYVDLLRPQVDLVVGVSHASYHQDIEYIPRTEGLDIVFGGHLHIVLDPPSVIQDCDVQRLKRERDRYICDTPEKLRFASRACQTRNGCDLALDKAGCIADCDTEAKVACDREAAVRRYKQRLAELDGDVAFLEKRGCHPRNVLLVHSGAFLKFVGKLSTTLRQCQRVEPREVCVERDSTDRCLRSVPRRCYGNASGRNDWEVVAHKYELIPVDRRLPQDPQMLQLLEPFTLELSRQELLTQVIAHAPQTWKRFSAGTGDSPLGNLVTGIRSDLVRGPVDEEGMINVFPFDNMITTLYLSGYEVQEVFDFIAQKSATRGCQSQAQIAGATVVLNCGKCPGKGGNPCARDDYSGEPCAQRVTIGGSGRPCTKDKDCEVDAATGKPTAEICTNQLHPDQAKNPQARRCWLPIECSRNYLLATNDYIAHGGSGFTALGRNTTQKNLGIPLRRAAIDWMTRQLSCSQIRVEPEPGRPPPSVLSAADVAALHDAEAKAQTGDAAKIQAANETWGTLRKDLEERAKATPSKEVDALRLYLSCTAETKDSNNVCDGLACMQSRACDEYKAKDIDRCKALGRIRAALRCVTLPCLVPWEDGRISRILRDSSGSPDPFEPWPE